MEAVRREIVVELERVQLIRKRAPTVRIFCQACWRESDFVSTTDAARIFGLRSAEINDFAERGLAHSVRHSAKTFICAAAIVKHLTRVSRSVKPRLIG